MIHTSLLDYYRVNETLNTLYNYNIQDIEQMYPYERDIYIDLNIQRRDSTE